MAAHTLRNQRIVVIGGTSGIGFSVAQEAIADGADVIVGPATPPTSTRRLADSAAARPVRRST